MSDSLRRGVIESQGKSSGWIVRFADKSRSFRVADLKLLPSDVASFEPSQAPLSAREILRARSSAPESTRKCFLARPEGTVAEGTAAEGTAARGTAADSDSDSDECPICLEVLDATTAVLLDCTHVFCAACHKEKLSRLPSSRQTRAGAIIECPMCRKLAKVVEIA